MRIIQVFNRYLNPGGEENSAARIGRDLEKGGHSVTRFWRASSEWTEPGAPSRFRQPILLWRNRAVLEELRRCQEREQADVWILHNVIPVVSLGVYALAGRLRVPIIQWLHNYRPISPSGTLFAGATLLRPEDRWIAWKETWAGSWNGVPRTACVALGYAWARWRRQFESVKAWVAVSEEMRQVFVRAGWYPARLHMLRHSWDGQCTVAPEDGGYFLFLGRIVESKGIRFLVDLWRDPVFRKVELVVAGQGDLEAELRANSPPNIRWIGYVEGAEKARWVSGCRAILFPSTWPEPLSTVAYEAYTFEKPILAGDRGGMKEIVFNDVTGRVLPVGDGRQWMEAIMSLVRDPGRGRRLGENGRRWLEANVSSERWNEGFNRILCQAGIARA